MEIPITDEFSQQYQELSTPARVGGDRYLLAFVFAFGLLLAGIFTGYVIRKRRKDNKGQGTNAGILAVVIALILCTIIVGLFGPDWETGSAAIDPSIVVSAASGVEIGPRARLGILIGTRGFNVTLHAPPAGNERRERLWNEHFSWSAPEWRHRTIVSSFQAAIETGIPLPVYDLAEAMTLDSEGIRWGRRYREAGYYTWIFLWTAFAACIFAALVLSIVVYYRNNGNSIVNTDIAYALLLSATFQTAAWVTWFSLAPKTFPMATRYGVSAWVTLAGSIISFTASGVLFVRARKIEKKTKTV